MRIETFEVGPHPTNCYLIINEETNKTLIVDPGVTPEGLLKYVSEAGLVPEAILLTHGHYDHLGGVPEWLAAYPDLPVYAHEDEAAMLGNPQLNMTAWQRQDGVSITDYRKAADGEVLHLIGEDIRVLHLPGHTAGGCAYYFESKGRLFAGDTIFYHDVGRTDLPTGSTKQLLQSINDRLMALPDETVVFCGHGPATTIGEERAYNPYVR